MNEIVIDIAIYIEGAKKFEKLKESIQIISEEKAIILL